MAASISHYPDFQRFCQMAEAGADLVPVYRRLVSDSLTPVSAFHKLDEGRCACLFESVVGGEKVGRYSFLATHPFLEIEAYENRVTISSPSGVSASGAPILVTRQIQVANPAGRAPPPRRGRAARSRFPNCPRFAAAPWDMPATTWSVTSNICPTRPKTTGRCPTWLSPSTTRWSSSTMSTKTIVVVAMARLDKHGADRRVAYDDACRRVDALVDQLGQRPLRSGPCRHRHFERAPALPSKSNFTQADFEAAVRQCVEYIRAGDIFQVVFSQRLEVPLHVHPFADLSRAARGESQPVHVLRAHAPA